MTETKPWYLSRTVWAALVALAAGIGGAVGLPLADFDQSQAVETILQAMSAVAGLAALLGRLGARSRIG